MAPGEVFDLWELYLSAHGKNRGEEGVYESLIDGNAYSPTAYPAGWKLIE